MQCFKDPERVVQSAHDALAPGGWLEFQDIYMPLRCIDDTFEGTTTQRYGVLFAECMAKLGRDVTYSQRYPQMFRDAGLVDVRELHFVWPMNPWPKGKHLKRLGALFAQDMLEGLEAFSMALFTRVAGLTKETVVEILEEVRKEIPDTSIHAYLPM